MNIWIYAIVMWSGYFVMALELLGGRLLGPYFGSGIHVWGALITLFMLSLSIGYILGGHLSQRLVQVRQLAVLLLTGAGAVLPMIFLGDKLSYFVFVLVEDPRYGALLTSLLLFFMPILVLGMISPYAVQLLVKSADGSGKVTGKIFFLSTLGSTLGTLITSFYLVMYLEIHHILMAMVAVSAVLSIWGLVQDPAKAHRPIA